MEALRQILSPDFLLRNSVYTSVLVGFCVPPRRGVSRDAPARLHGRGAAADFLHGRRRRPLPSPVARGPSGGPRLGRRARPCLCGLDDVLPGGDPGARFSRAARAWTGRRQARRRLRRGRRIEHPAACEKPLRRDRLARYAERRGHHHLRFRSRPHGGNARPRPRRAWDCFTRSCSWSPSTGRWRSRFGRMSFSGTCCSMC